MELKDKLKIQENFQVKIRPLVRDILKDMKIKIKYKDNVDEQIIEIEEDLIVYAEEIIL